MKHKNHGSSVKVILFSLLLINSIFGVLFFSYMHRKSTVKELSIINQKLSIMNDTQIQTFFEDIAKQKGGVYAFSLLRRASLPPGNDTHLIGHRIGEEFYKQRGISGIKDCTQDFRNACSHSIIIGAFIQFGESALPKIETACDQAPGGSGAYLSCFHGAGHGIFSYTGYDFAKTRILCEKLGTGDQKNAKIAECMGGAVMEIISGGGHDEKTWTVQRKKYLHTDTPFSLCEPDNMPEVARNMCYIYITPYLWETVRQPNKPVREKTFKEAMALCENVSDAPYKNTCYAGFGKEYVAYAKNYDTRDDTPLTLDQAQTIRRLCALAPNTEGEKACIGNSVGSLFWSGQSNYKNSLLFCSVYTESEMNKYCIENFLSSIQTNDIDKKTSKAICDSVPSAYTAYCENSLLLK